ncbi:hypothetical protein [Nesterenkonia sp. NBAIMH1]|uniref:hypothetical protein n=1 Tax=Nesterenkonia sp. NBAIMH1 TaxID=2600320 RepID=UPI0011B7E53D|nr:hypothetical protein [Nesterenkonia sp. NBAIMH1]
MGRVTPLAGRALRSAGLFRWGFPQERGGLSASFAERLEAITQLARVDVGTAWVTTWLSAHGDIAGRLTDEAFAEIYPHADLPTAFSATPLARAVEVEGDRYRLDEGTTWRLGSGGYHAERWIGGAMVWDTNGEPVICEQTGEQKIIGVWLPPEKVRQLDDWDPLGVRSSGSASYRLTETIEVPRRHSFNVGADRRPYFFSFMGVMVGAAEHLVDLTMTALRAKSAKGAPIGFHDTARLTQAMASLDMMVIGLRGYAAHIDRIAASSDSGAPSVADTAWIESVGMPVRQAVLEISDIATDIFGTGYVASGSEFGRVLRDIQVALAHWWFRLSDTQAPRGNRVRMMLEDPTVATVWDTPWPTEPART